MWCDDNNYFKQEKKCNCRNGDNCPLRGDCQARNIVYQATVATDKDKETYIGLTENTFKTRFTNHKASFKNPKLEKATELSKHIWKLKREKINYSITWKKIKQSRSYNNMSNSCSLCTWEKLFIIFHQDMASLNKRSEIVATCRHKRKFSLREYSGGGEDR